MNSRNIQLGLILAGGFVGSLIGAAGLESIIKFVHATAEGKMMITSPGELFRVRFWFATGTGTAFACIPLAGLIGLKFKSHGHYLKVVRMACVATFLTCFVVTMLYRRQFVSANKSAGTFGMASLFHLSTSPVRRIPWVGAAAALSVGFIWLTATSNQRSESDKQTKC